MSTRQRRGVQAIAGGCHAWFALVATRQRWPLPSPAQTSAQRLQKTCLRKPTTCTRTPGTPVPTPEIFPAAATAASSMASQEGNAGNTVTRNDAAERAAAASPSGTTAPAPVGNASLPRTSRGTLRRGLSNQLSTDQLQVRSWTIALSLAKPLQVIRTLDVAVACYPERPFKTALGAAQRAVRGMVKADLLRRYKTARSQTTYGLTARGVAWLAERVSRPRRRCGG